MTDEHVGMYIRLLCLQHQKGRLTEKDMLCICKAYAEDVYLKFAKDGSGKYYNKRMETESLKRKAYSKSRQTNAAQRYKKNKNVTAYADTYALHMENENINENGNGNKNRNSSFVGFIAPSIEVVRAYCLERENDVDPQRFVDFYASKGWMVGKNKMKDWKAAIRNWETREQKKEAHLEHSL